MSDPILYIDKSEIIQEYQDEIKPAINELVNFIEKNEPQLISYNFYFSKDGSTMTVTALHPDSASMELHMEIGAPLFRKFAKYLNLLKIEVYGDITDKVMQQLKQKADMLGDGNVEINKLYAGFTRIDVE